MWKILLFFAWLVCMLCIESIIIFIASPEQSEQEQLLTSMEERLKKQYGKNPSKVQRLLAEYRASLRPVSLEEAAEKNEELYEKFPELRPIDESSSSLTSHEVVTAEEVEREEVKEEDLSTDLEGVPEVNKWVAFEKPKDLTEILPEGFPKQSFLAKAANTISELECEYSHSLMWTRHCEDLKFDLEHRFCHNFIPYKSNNGHGGTVLTGKTGVGKVSFLVYKIFFSTLICSEKRLQLLSRWLYGQE